MKFVVLVALFGYLSCAEADSDPGASFDVNLLATSYSLKTERSDPLLMAAPYGNDKCDRPLAQGYLMVLEKGLESYAIQHRDRILMWHKGKALVGMFKEDGTIDVVCLGDTLRNKTCKYSVAVPAEKVTKVHALESSVVTLIILGGTTRDGKMLPKVEVEEKFAGMMNM